MRCRTEITSPFKEQLDNMTWSFSRVNSYATCPKMFKMTYLDVDENGKHKYPMAENAFALWGTHCHECLERFFNDELLSFEVLDAYEDGYDEAVYMDFPPNKYKNLSESYYDAGVEYFSNLTDLPGDWKAIGVEQKIELDIDGRKFVGYIDLILQNESSGEIVIVDHKSKSKFASAEELEHYAYQPYLYSIWIKEKYGVYPIELVFNMFRAGDIVRVPFSQAGLEKALAWFHSTIDQIYRDTKFKDRIAIDYQRRGKALREYTFADYFCRWICSVRYSCIRSLTKKRGEKDGFE